MSEEFDPSPRASKRRRTTPSVKHTQLSSTEKPTQLSNNQTSAIKTPRRVSSRLKAVSQLGEDVDSAYGSKEDSLVEDELAGDVSAAPEAAAARTTATLQSAESIEIPETPGDITGRFRTSAKRKTPRNATSTAKDNTSKSGAGSKRKSRDTNSGGAKKNAGAVDSEDQQQDNGDRATIDPTKPEPEIQESQDELQEETGPGPVREASSRPRRRPRRYSIESQSTQDQSAVPSKSRRATASAAASPQPRGILTPSRGRRNGQRKSVLFESGEKEIEEQLGFKDIDTSVKKARRSARATKVVTNLPEDEDEDEDEDAEVEEIEAPTPAPANDPLLDFDQPLDILASLEPVGAVIAGEAVEDSPIIRSIKARVLARLTSAQPCAPAPHLASQQSTLTNLLTSTVVSGESNSLLLLGPRGAGKTLLLEHILDNLKSQYADLFHTVRLNGFFQTDDRVALREIWRQLGRETQEEDAEENAMAPISYADTLASLLSLLSHPDEMDVDTDAGPDLDPEAPVKTAKAVVIILDEFDLFTLHPRQTLLYNLFDIAQSRKAPIAVIGCSTRMDAVESLEKRVKSRFSHRWLHVHPVRTLAEMQDVVKTALLVSRDPDANVAADQRVNYPDEADGWNDVIKTSFLPSEPISEVITQIFHTTRSIPETFSALYPLIATLVVPDTITSKPDYLAFPRSTLSQTVLSLLPTLPTLHLSLLAALSSPSHPPHSLLHHHLRPLRPPPRAYTSRALFQPRAHHGRGR